MSLPPAGTECRNMTAAADTASTGTARAAVEGVLGQFASGLQLTQVTQLGGQVVGRHQRAGVIFAQDAALAVQVLLVQVASDLRLVKAAEDNAHAGGREQARRDLGRAGCRKDSGLGLVAGPDEAGFVGEDDCLDPVAQR